MIVSRSSSEKRLPALGPRSINRLAMRWLYLMNPVLLLRSHRHQIRDHVGQLLPVELHLQTLGHQRFGGGLDRLDLTAEERVFHFLGAAKRDARCGFGSDDTGHDATVFRGRQILDETRIHLAAWIEDIYE